jgi:hypothetical protein
VASRAVRAFRLREAFAASNESESAAAATVITRTAGATISIESFSLNGFDVDPETERALGVALEMTQTITPTG